jgi:predicted nucleic-acid-binding Zn-ribbon protein
MLKEWIIGEWYLAVRCKNCDTEFAFQKDSEEFDPGWVISKTEFVLTCPECRVSEAYGAGDVLTVQAKG